MDKYSANSLNKFTSKEAGENRLLLDLGCGKRKRLGYIGIDSVKLDGVDIVCDIEKGLPFEDNIIDGIWSNFLFEHILSTESLFKEIYRICKNEAIIEFRVPHYQSLTQYQDPTHKAIILPETMRYFTLDDWYGSDYKINTNFKLLEVKYDYLPPFNFFIAKRLFFLWPITYPVLLFARRFLWNVVHSITMKLKVVK
ncbi:MAG: class I SAM-dependent methyltransferase [Elusimicrobia bacterium]|nr:class I SAM-dependent methyltransferase [Elusimicrobiota bacterium]